jgi:hypothetical protein
VIAWGDRAARSWTTFYTRGLVTEVADRRRAEIRSDLFEHADAEGRGVAQQMCVLGRVLWGIPADLSWRRAARASQARGHETGAPMILHRITLAVVIGVGLFELWAAVGTLTADGAGPLYAVALVGGATLVGMGLAQRRRSAAASKVMIIAGAAVPVVVFYWMAPIFVPALVLISALVLVAGTGPRQPEPAV